MNEENYKKSIELLKSIAILKLNHNKPSIANQGQAMDGFALLYAYNSIADNIIKFLKKIEKGN